MRRNLNLLWSCAVMLASIACSALWPLGWAESYYVTPPRTGIMAFCGIEDIRHYMQKPWKKDGKVYATNGHILIETTVEFAGGDDWPEYEEGRMPKKIPTMFADADARTTHYSALPELPPIKPCESCDGKGRVEWYWDEDEDGTSYKRRDGEMHVCSDCDGYGEAFHRIAVLDSGFQARYLRLLASLPGIEFAPHGDQSCPFRFNAVRGLLMPCRER